MSKFKENNATKVKTTELHPNPRSGSKIVEIEAIENRNVAKNEFNSAIARVEIMHFQTPDKQLQKVTKF